MNTQYIKISQSDKKAEGFIRLSEISQKSGMRFPRPIVCFFLFAVFCSSTVSAKLLYDSSTLARPLLEAHSTKAELYSQLTKISKTENRLTRFSLKCIPQYLSRPQPFLICLFASPQVSCVQHINKVKMYKEFFNRHLNQTKKGSYNHA